jgi:hypothetical protein
LLLALLGLLAVGKVVLADTLDPDCFWHLRVGAELARQAWPHDLVDDLSFASIRQPWTPYSWLAELAMKWLWDAGGFRAAVAVQAIMESAFILLIGLGGLELSARVHGTPRYLASAIGAAIGGVLSLAYLSFRPVTAALLILALVAWLLLRDRRMKGRFRLVWLVPELTAVLVNIHFFALFVPLWIGAILCGDLFESRVRETPRIGRTALLLAASLVACLMTPLLAGTVHSILDYSTSDVMVRSAAIAEFRPFYLGVLGNFTAIFVLVLAFGVLYRVRREPRVPIGEALWFTGSTILLFRMGRMSPVFAIIAGPMFAAIVPGLKDRILTRRPILAALAVVLVIISAQIVRGFPKADEPFYTWLNRNGPDAPNYPCLAANFVDENMKPRTHHILCDLSWGGFLEWRLGDRYQTLMDGRTQLFTADFWKSAALGTPAQRREFLSKIPADVAIVRAGPSGLGEALNRLNWKTVYRDDFAQVLVPPGAEALMVAPKPEAVSKTE